MAKCFDVTGYIEPCNTVRDKYTGRALLLFGRGNEGLVPIFSENGLIVNRILDSEGFDSLVSEVNNKNAKALPISIDAQNPFGVTVQGNIDSGRVMYTKTIPVSIPATLDGKAEAFIMGLQKGLYCDVYLVLEHKRLSINGKEDYVANDIFGTYSPVRLDPTSVTRNEYENGGAWSFNLVCEEPVPNVICTMPALEAALETLKA